MIELTYDYQTSLNGVWPVLGYKVYPTIRGPSFKYTGLVEPQNMSIRLLVQQEDLQAEIRRRIQRLLVKKVPAHNAAIIMKFL
jgi:hypothetical protein